jgi:hypothetical protein
MTDLCILLCTLKRRVSSVLTLEGTVVSSGGPSPSCPTPNNGGKSKGKGKGKGER